MASSKTSIIERQAQAILLQFERAGMIVRPYSCQRCRYFPAFRMGIQAHHNVAYDLPLHVVWLCIECHEKEHRKLRQEGRSVPLSSDESGDLRACPDAPSNPQEPHQ